jgi:phage nucleotide-binding protein
MLLTKPNELSVKLSYAGLIYGQPGVGKTTLALSSVNPVCIDVDRGMYRIEKRYQVPSLQMEDYNQLLDLLNSNEINSYETIVIDTLGKLIDRISDYVTKNNPKYRQSNGQLTMQGWGQVKIEFRSLVKLVNSKNKSVLFVAHESEEKDGNSDAVKKRPDVSGSARKDIVKELDFMGYMEMSGNKRTISFSPNSSYYAKNSLGLDAVIEVPDIASSNSFIRDVVVASLEKKKEEDAAMAAPYEETINSIDGIVEAVKDTASLNDALEKVSDFKTIWDSKLYA